MHLAPAGGHEVAEEAVRRAVERIGHDPERAGRYPVGEDAARRAA